MSASNLPSRLRMPSLSAWVKEKSLPEWAIPEICVVLDAYAAGQLLTPQEWRDSLDSEVLRRWGFNVVDVPCDTTADTGTPDPSADPAPDFADMRGRVSRTDFRGSMDPELPWILDALIGVVERLYREKRVRNHWLAALEKREGGCGVSDDDCSSGYDPVTRTWSNQARPAPAVPVAPLRELVARWRAELHWLEDWLPDTARRMTRFADEMDALLTRHAGPQG